MEKKIYNYVWSWCFGAFLVLPIILIILTTFRTGVIDIESCFDFCSKCIIPFVNNACSSLADVFNLPSDTYLVIFFSYYISVFVYYLCVELFICALHLIHHLFHLIDKKIERGVK